MSTETISPAATSLPAAQVPYCGFWRRGVAFVLDNLIASIPVYLLMLPFFVISAVTTTQEGFEEIGALVFAALYIFLNLFSLISMWLYFAFMESSKYQATFGKRILGIKVVNEKGERISFAHATGRFFSKILSYLSIYVGFLFVPFTNRKRALHDMIASTYVVKAEYQPGQPLPPTPAHIGTLVAVCITFVLLTTLAGFFIITSGTATAA